MIFCPACSRDRLAWDTRQHGECFNCRVKGISFSFPYGGRQAFKDRSIVAEQRQLEKTIAKTHPEMTAKQIEAARPQTARWV